MIPLEIKQESSKLPLQKNVKSSDEPENTLSFKELLLGVKEVALEAEEIQNGAFVLALEDDVAAKSDLKAQTTTLLSTGADTQLRELESFVDKEITLNTKLTQHLSITELKQLIHDAKAYLKKQITASEGFLRSEATKLPKTLKGLVDFANKLGIDVSKITLESIERNSLAQQGSASGDLQEELSSTPKKDEFSFDEELPVEHTKVKKKLQQTPKVQQNNETLAEELTSMEKKFQTEKKDAKKNVQILAKEPLFQAQSKREVSTQELVCVKLQTQQESPIQKSKKRSDDTLKLLLQGKSVTQGNDKVFLTQDFSTATARVIAPQALRESDKSLESLLHGESTEGEAQDLVKNEASTKALKADSFEVKLNEAKQMTKYLSQDVKNAIDNYKAPFTRLKVQLNPERLGEIELTVVQRGKNLHVNLSSNNAAINALAMNANDLKVQLQNSGINNASLNFSNNAQSQDQSASQQQQHRRESQNEYSYFETEEQNEEIVSSLEIVVPNYA